MSSGKPSSKRALEKPQAVRTETGLTKILCRPALIGLLLAVATVVAYWPVARHEFTTYDDPQYVTTNPHVSGGLNWNNIKHAFVDEVVGNWHPVTMLSHLLDCQILGLRPGGHHLTSLLFHTLNTVLLFVLLRRMTGALWRSAFVAALFALHPLHVESVAWVAERKDVLSTFFGLLVLLAYERFVARSKVQGPKSKVFYGLALLLFALGLMSKPMLVTLPFVLLLLDFWPLQRFAPVAPKRGKAGVQNSRFTIWHLVREKIPFFLLSAIFCGVTLWAQNEGHSVVTLDAFPLRMRIENALVSYARYLGKTFWPSDLTVYYPYPEQWALLHVVIAAGVVAFLCWVTIWSARRFPFMATGWLWFLGTLIPVIGLVQVGSQSMADRYTYIPLIGVFIVCSWGLAGIIARWQPMKTAGIIVAISFLGICAALTTRQLQYWQNTGSLFRHALAVTKDNYIAHGHLGLFLLKAREFGEAEVHCREALAIEPADAQSHNNLGLLLLQRGEFAEAEVHLLVALKLRPEDPEVLNNLGLVLAGEKRFAEAATRYEEALRLDSEKPEIYYNLGNTLTGMGKTREAVDHFTKALQLNPNYPEAHVNMGVTLVKQGKPSEAIVHLHKAIQTNPTNADAYNNLGCALAALGKTNEAMENYIQALRFVPNYGPAHENLADALRIQGRMDEAKTHYFAALSASSESAAPNYRLGIILASEGDEGGAISHFREAIRLEPDSIQSLNSLAWLLATSTNAGLRNGSEAVRLGERTARLTEFKNPFVLDSLAAAYAESGRFAEAVETIQKATNLAAASGNEKFVAEIRSRLEEYKSGRAHRE